MRTSNFKNAAKKEHLTKIHVLYKSYFYACLTISLFKTDYISKLCPNYVTVGKYESFLWSVSSAHTVSSICAEPKSGNSRAFRRLSFWCAFSSALGCKHAPCMHDAGRGNIHALSSFLTTTLPTPPHLHSGLFSLRPLPLICLSFFLLVLVSPLVFRFYKRGGGLPSFLLSFPPPLLLGLAVSGRHGLLQTKL